MSFKDAGFAITDAGLAAVDFQVTKNPEASAACAVQVLNNSYAVVGWKQIVIGPAEESTTSHRLDIRTDSLGVTGGVNACWLLDGA